MLTIEKVGDGRTVTLKGLPLTPRTFAVRDEDGKVVEGATGSLGYGLYTPVVIDGLRHQLTLNVVVNKSKGWTDDEKLEWMAANTAAIEAEVSGYADTFRNAANTGWRINAQGIVAGKACTFSGSLVLSGKTVKAEGKKAQKQAAKQVKAEAAVARHDAAIAKAQEAKDKALAALKASIKA